MYVLGREPPDNNAYVRTYVLGREILIDPRNNVCMYLLGIIDPMQIIMYICT